MAICVTSDARESLQETEDNSRAVTADIEYDRRDASPEAADI